MVSNNEPTWSDIADWYDELLTRGSGPHETATTCLEDLLLPVDGKQVIDVACGQGIASRLLARRGALVVGVDSSATMIDNARRHATAKYWQLDSRSTCRYQSSSQHESGISRSALPVLAERVAGEVR